LEFPPPCSCQIGRANGSVVTDNLCSCFLSEC
jgi:hypothetical protein